MDKRMKNGIDKGSCKQRNDQPKELTAKPSNNQTKEHYKTKVTSKRRKSQMMELPSQTKKQPKGETAKAKERTTKPRNKQTNRQTNG